MSDYPYGRLRTKIRYWVELAEKGAGKGRYREVSCTLNPASGVWNRPKAGNYYDVIIMYLERQDDGRDFVKFHHIHSYGGSGFNSCVRSGLYFALTADERAKVDEQWKVYAKVNGSYATEKGEQYERLRQGVIDNPELTIETYNANHPDATIPTHYGREMLEMIRAAGVSWRLPYCRD